MTRRTAAPPFDNPRADLVLRSADDIHFYVRRAILAEASPLFEDMLSLPQPPSSPSCDTEPPVVDLTEPSSTLEPLLRLCYPASGSHPEPPTVEATFALLDAAKKYLMAGPLRALQTGALPAACARDPLSAYAAACARGWADEARAAARAALARPLAELACAGAELDALSAGAYLRLAAYHRACRRAAAGLHYGGVAGPSGARVWVPRRVAQRCGVAGAAVEQWWVQYMERAREALGVRPCGAAVLAPELSYGFLLEVGVTLPLGARTRVLFELAQFNQGLAESVERAVSQVQLEVKM